MTLYEGPERRDQALTEDRVKLMIADAVQQALASHEQHLMAHMDRQFASLRQSFADAFPGGDPHGHRVAHERQIANATWWDKVKGDAVGKATAAGLWAVVVFLCVAAWEHIKSEAKR
jgi:hypothetical protein